MFLGAPAASRMEELAGRSKPMKERGPWRSPGWVRSMVFPATIASMPSSDHARELGYPGAFEILK